MDLLVVTALRAELEGALPALGKPIETLAVPTPGALALYEVAGLRVAAGYTGIGREATERFFDALPRRPSAIVHLGVAGGLRDGLVAGDAMLCAHAHSGDETIDCAAEERLAGLLACPRSGGCVTVDAVAGTPRAKRALAARYPDALVVEMETFWAARKTRSLGVPSAFVRVVIDAVDDALPDLSPALDSAGRPRPLAMLKHLATRPKAIRQLPKLASAFSRAQNTIAELIGRVTSTPNANR